MRSNSSSAPFPARSDGQEPIVFVRFAAGLDGDETGAEPCGDGGIRNGGELQVAIAVADAGDGSNDGGGSGAEGFGEFSQGLSRENFAVGNLSFLRPATPLPP